MATIKNRVVSGIDTTNTKKIVSNTSFARIYYWHYKKQNFGCASNVRSPLTNFFDVFVDTNLTFRNFIEREISSLKISKSIEQASATFDITLLPTVNWKKYVMPGDWLAIYMFQSFPGEAQFPPNSNNLVLLGNVDRVSRTIIKEEETDTTQLRYKISGRNFGKVFENMDIWYDPYVIQNKVLDVALRTQGYELIGNPTQQFKNVIDIFLGPGITDDADNEQTSPLKQWGIPSAITTLFQDSDNAADSDPSLYNILRFKIEDDLPGFRTRNMITVDSNGNLYEVMKRAANEIVNEVIIEEQRFEDGVYPTVTLRPRPFNTPFFDDNFGNETNKANIKALLKGHIKTLQEHAKDNFIEIAPSEVVYEDLGKDDHSRLNMFILESGQASDYCKSIWANYNTADIIGNPMVIRESVMRYGLKRMEGSLEFDMNEESVSGGFELDLFKAFMVQVYDANFANHLFETGTIECVGILEAELGKALILLPNRGVKNGKEYPEGTKVFFIEGYEHSLEYPNRWKTIFSLSKGQFLTPNKNIFIDVDSDDSGADEKLISATFVAQTDVVKK